jgi:predicted nucleic acid-binding protein
MSDNNKIVIDTNLYIYASWGYAPAVQLINEIRFDEDYQLFMPSVIQAELLSIPRTQKDLAYKDIIDGYISHANEQGMITQIDPDIAQIAANIRVLWMESEEKKLALPDAIIAATAIKHSAKLYSNNDKDFVYAVQHLRLEYENPIDRVDLKRFQVENGFEFKESNTMESVKRTIESMDAESLRELAYKSISHLNDTAKKEHLKFARELKKKKRE